MPGEFRDRTAYRDIIKIADSITDAAWKKVNDMDLIGPSAPETRARLAAAYIIAAGQMAAACE